MDNEPIDYDEEAKNPKDAARFAVDGYAALQNDLLRFVKTVAAENKRRFETDFKSEFGELQLAFTGASRLYTRIKEVVEFADHPAVRYHLRRHMRAVHAAHKGLMDDLAKVAVLRTSCDDNSKEQVDMLVHVVERVMFILSYVDKRLGLNAKDEARRMGRKRTRQAKAVWKDIDRSFKKAKKERTLH